MSKLIMVVEDEIAIRDLLIAVIEDDGIFDTVGAGSGLVALNLLKTITVDLITLDMNMPEMNGNTFLTELAMVAPSIPVVVITATPLIFEKNTQVKALLTKPFEINMLLQTLETYSV